MTAGRRTRESGVGVYAVVRRTDRYGVITILHTDTHTFNFRDTYGSITHTAKADAVTDIFRP